MYTKTLADIAKPWVPPLMKGRIKSFIYKNGAIKKYKKGAVLVNEDDYLTDIFILKKGILSNSIIHHELNKSFMACGIRLPGHISGYTTFILREPAPVRITALSSVEVACVSFDAMDVFLDESPELKAVFLRHCGKCLRSEIDTLLAVVTLTAEERFWILMAAILSTTDSIPVNKDGWLYLPFKISREAMSYLLYVSIVTIDRLYAALIKNNLIRREKGQYALSAAAVDTGLKWIQTRYNVASKLSVKQNLE